MADQLVHLHPVGGHFFNGQALDEDDFHREAELHHDLLAGVVSAVVGESGLLSDGGEPTTTGNTLTLPPGCRFLLPLGVVVKTSAEAEIAVLNGRTARLVVDFNAKGAARYTATLTTDPARTDGLVVGPDPRLYHLTATAGGREALKQVREAVRGLIDALVTRTGTKATAHYGAAVRLAAELDRPWPTFAPLADYGRTLQWFVGAAFAAEPTAAGLRQWVVRLDRLTNDSPFPDRFVPTGGTATYDHVPGPLAAPTGGRPVADLLVLAVASTPNPIPAELSLARGGARPLPFGLSGNRYNDLHIYTTAIRDNFNTSDRVVLPPDLPGEARVYVKSGTPT
jgi:hypothetical protein